MKRNLDIPQSPSGKKKESSSKSKSSTSKTQKASKKTEEKWEMESLSKPKHNREQLVYLTKLAESCKDYERMAKFVAEYCKHEPCREMSKEERELLSVAFRHMIRERRQCWRLISKKRAELKHKMKKNQDELSGNIGKTLFDKKKNLSALEQM